MPISQHPLDVLTPRAAFLPPDLVVSGTAMEVNKPETAA